MTLRSALVCTLALGLLAGCAQLGLSWMAVAGPRPEIEVTAPSGPAPWTGLAPRDDPGSFHFAVVSDRTGEHRDGVFRDAMPRLNLLQPAFVLSVGDLIEGYTDDPARLGAEWDEIAGFVRALDMPFFYAAGNHDMSNATMAETWQERFGPSYYHFVYRDVLFLVLNSELFGMVHDPQTSLPGPFVQAEQMAFAEQVLARHTNARWTFVVVHQPLWDAPKIHPDWLQIEEWLGSRPYTVFAGHYHRYTRHLRRGRNYVTLATTGGGSGLRGTPFGEFDHVAFVTMGEREPVIANVEIDGIHPVDVRSDALRDRVDKLARVPVPLPWLGKGGTFRGGTAAFELSNPLDRPVEVEAHIDGGRDLVATTPSWRGTLAPGAVERLELAFTTAHPARYEELAPARASFTLRTRDAKGEPLEIEVERPIVADRRFRVAQAKGLAVDGDLTDWGRLRFVVDVPAEAQGHGRYAGPADASFRFDVKQDAEHLYLAVDVTDDSLVVSRSETARAQDALSLAIDARPAEERDANPRLFDLIRSGAMRRMVSALIPLGEARDDPILELFAGGAPDVVTERVARNATGYQVELSIPHAVLDEHAGGRWEALRLNLTVNDFDAEEPNHMSLSWRPSRYGAGAAEGAGTFVR